MATKGKPMSVKRSKTTGHPDPIILFEGPCAYVVKTGACYGVMVHSSNYSTHKPAGITENEERAKRTCDGLNRYPRQTPQGFDLL